MTKAKGNVALSEDGHLLMRMIHQSKIKRVIDVSKIDMKKKITAKQMVRASQKGGDDNVISDTYNVQQLYKYVDPEENDVVVYYDDIGALSGSTGYILLREGYVYNSVLVSRS